MLRRPSLTLLTAAALLVGHLSSVAHLLLVEHQRCPEHGELIHTRAPSRLARAANHGAQAVVTAASSVDSHNDDHCLGSAAKNLTAGTARADARALILLFPGKALLARDPVTASRPYLLGLAPKTSPPSIG